MNNSNIDPQKNDSEYDKYKERLENELNPGEEGGVNKSYSQDYLDFKKEQQGRFHAFFEKFCNISQNILNVEVKETDKEKVEPFLRLAHFNTTAKGVYSFAYLSGLLSIIISVFVTIIFRSLLGIVGGFIAFIFLIFFIPSYPKTTFIKWRAKASDQLVLAVMYLVIQMERLSNLELAVEFVARHTSPPVSLDFMKVLWDVETKKFSSVTESLERYIQTWRGWNDDFIEAVHLVQFSLQQSSKTERINTLNRATKVVLSGTQQHMLKYAHSLQGPMQALHMLGVVLPLMALVMLPMIGAFMGGSVAWYHLAIMYNFLFPIMVYTLGKDMLQKRPAGTSGGDSYSYMLAKYKKPYIKLGNTKLKVPPIVISILIFVTVGAPGIIYFTSNIILASTNMISPDYIFDVPALLFALDLVLAVGLAVGAYFYYSVYYLIKLKHKIERIESEFPSGIFQLANRIKEKIPAEIAFEKVARTMMQSDIGGLFWLVDYNLKKQGTDLKDAIFNEKYGAISFYPSGIIKSALAVMVDAVKKGPVSAAKSLFSISTYLTNLKKVNDRLNDLLAETTSSMRMQISMFIPLITGMVVGLNMLITKILRNLGTVLSETPTTGSSSSQVSMGADILAIFQFDSMIPAFASALIVGIYIVEIVCLIAYLINGISNGYDTIELKYLIGKSMFIAVPFYCLVSGLAGLMLTQVIAVMPT